MPEIITLDSRNIGGNPNWAIPPSMLREYLKELDNVLPGNEWEWIQPVHYPPNIIFSNHKHDRQYYIILEGEFTLTVLSAPVDTKPQTEVWRYPGDHKSKITLRPPPHTGRQKERHTLHQGHCACVRKDVDHIEQSGPKGAIMLNAHPKY